LALRLDIQSKTWSKTLDFGKDKVTHCVWYYTTTETCEPTVQVMNPGNRSGIAPINRSTITSD